MKKRFMTLALALTIMFGGIGLTYAQEDVSLQHKEQIQKMKIEKTQRLANLLNLSEEQIQKTEEIKAASKEKIRPLIQKKKAKFDEIKQIKDNDDILVKVQDEKIEKIIKEIKATDVEIRQIKQDERKAFKAILTDEQKVKYEQLKKECDFHKRPHKKHHHPKKF